MVSARPFRRPKSAVTMAVCLVSLGCGASVPLTVASNEAMVYSVLAIDAPFQEYNGVPIVVANTGDPRLAVVLKPAERIVVRRQRDRALLNVLPFTPPPGSRVGYNYALAESTTVQGLGWRDLRPGETYELEVQTQGRSVTGRTTIPERPVLRVVYGTTIDTVFWSRSSTAAAYESDYRSASDTSMLVPRVSEPTAVYVTAVDQNYAAYAQDHRLLRSGIIGAFGLFGSSTTASITITPPAPTR